MSAFFGQEGATKEAGTTLIDYSPKKAYALLFEGDTEYVKADYVNFHAKYVSFWTRNPDADTQDTLVLAIRADWLDELKEVTP